MSLVVGLFNRLFSSAPKTLLTMSAKDTVETAIASNKIVIFSKSWCPYCTRAKGVLNPLVNSEDVYITELDQIDGGDKIQDYLAEKTGQRSVPNIFINKKHIGGCDKVVALNSSGELVDIIAATE